MLTHIFLGYLPHMFCLTLWPILANSSMHNPWSRAMYMCSIWFKSCEYLRTHACALNDCKAIAIKTLHFEW